MKVQWAPLALDRVAEIAAYIAEDNPAAAEKWIRAAFARAGRLGRFPKSGRPVPETPRQAMRELVWGNYRFIDRIEARQVSILKVRHMKQIRPMEDLK